MEEEKKQVSKTERALRITFWILVIAAILLLGAWLGKLVGIAFS